MRSTRLDYYRRTFSTYVLGRKRSQLSFWHDQPEASDFPAEEIGRYYMTFRQKADYPGPFDDNGIPLLDYGGDIGRQHNPIAIAQYGLANYNLVDESDDSTRRDRVMAVADWLVVNLQKNEFGQEVWNHHFRWEYREPLVPPWYSGLAQGQGISLLVRAQGLTGDDRYRDAAARAFVSMTVDVADGGVRFSDAEGHTWIEEYIVSPPTHILNGFIWALWGVRDWALASGDSAANDLFEAGTQTLLANLGRYDTGYWSRYELSGTRLDMLASPFYHRLHIVQLDVMHRLTGEHVFAEYMTRWKSYATSAWNRRRAFAGKALFKVVHY